MAIGMTYEQYWYDDPMMVRAFYKADKLRRERMDEEAWLNGLYILRALDATVGNAFRQKGQQPVTYPKEPQSLSERRERDEARKARDEEQEATLALAWMSSFVQAGKNWGKNKETKG